MGIIFKGGAGGGTRVGHVESGGIIYAYAGNRVGHVDSSGIIYAYAGNRVGHVESGGVVYAYPGTCVGHIESGGIIFKGGTGGGTCVGHVEGGDELVGGAALLLGLLDVHDKDDNKTEDNSEKPGCLSRIIGAIIAVIVAIVKHSWPGRIGVAYGLALGILMTIAPGMGGGGIGIGIFMSIIFMLICGPLGLLAGFISSKLSRHGNLGALIGAGAAGLTLVVLAIIEGYHLSWMFLFFLLGTVPGLVAGAIIGGIAGLIIKKKK